MKMCFNIIISSSSIGSSILSIVYMPVTQEVL